MSLWTAKNCWLGVKTDGWSVWSVKKETTAMKLRRQQGQDQATGRLLTKTLDSLRCSTHWHTYLVLAAIEQDCTDPPISLNILQFGPSLELESQFLGTMWTCQDLWHHQMSVCRLCGLTWVSPGRWASPTGGHTSSGPSGGEASSEARACPRRWSRYTFLQRTHKVDGIVAIKDKQANRKVAVSGSVVGCL